MGEDGVDGDAYLSIDYNLARPYSYEDNNPYIPDDLTYGQFYKCGAGIFNYEYYVDENFYLYGTYTLTINEGEPGKGFGEKGENGEDKYFILWCDPAGPHFEEVEGD